MIRSWMYRRPGRLVDLGHRGGGTAVADVGQDGVVKEVALLGHKADGGGQRCLAGVPHVDAMIWTEPPVTSYSRGIR